MHVNKTVNVAWDSMNTGGAYNIGTENCTNIYCHSQGTVANSPYSAPNVTANWAATFDCTACHSGDNSATNKMSTGSHSKHVQSANQGCILCHNATVSNNTTIGTFANHVNDKVNVAFTTLNPSALVNGLSTTAKDPGTAPVTCSNMYCHAAGSPTWSTGNGTLNCASCHAANSNLQGKHSVHYGVTTTALANAATNSSTAGAYIFGCGACHNPATTVHAGGEAAVNLRAAEVSFDATIAGGGTYSPGTSITGTDNNLRWTSGAANNACQNTYCHSNGTGGAPLVTSFTWSTNSTLNCAGCHGGQASDATPIASNKHTKHISTSAGNYGFACSKCHNTTTTTGTTITDKSLHVNKTINVAWDSMNSVGNYNNGTDTCTSVYCHSNGKVGTPVNTYATITWNAPSLGCNGCHGTSNILGSPDYVSGGTGSTANSHPKHTTSGMYNLGCQACHNSTTTTGTTIASVSMHVNRTIEVSFASGGTYSTTAKSCSNVSCHALSGGSTTVPTWGATLGCASCHGFPPNTGAHAKHIQSSLLVAQSYGSTTNGSNLANYAFGCGNCHPISNPNHGSGTVLVNLGFVNDGSMKSKNSSTAAYTAGAIGTLAGKCTAVYCHSDGSASSSIAASVQSVVTVSWNQTLAANACGACHGNPPQYASAGAGVAGANSHYNATGFMGKEGGHMLTLHWDNIYNKASGNDLLSTGSNTTNSSHGNATVATTMTCYICHSDTASSSVIDTYAMNGVTSSFKCSNCHNSGTTTTTQNGVIADKSKHVNGAADVKFASINFKTKAQLHASSTPSTWTTIGSNGSVTSYDQTIATLNAGGTYSATIKSCTVDCHMDNTVKWGDTTLDCNSCHTALP